MSEPPEPQSWPSRCTWAALTLLVMVGGSAWLFLRSPQEVHGLRMSPGTDQMLLTRHNDSKTYDIEGHQLWPDLVVAELAELDRIPPRDDPVTCLARSVPRALQEFQPLDAEGTHDFRFHGLTRAQVLDICDKLKRIPPLPRPAEQLVVRRLNLLLPGEDPGDLPVDIWVPSQELLRSHAEVEKIVGALEEMRALPPTPGKIQEIRKPMGFPRARWSWQGQRVPFFVCQERPTQIINLLNFFDSNRTSRINKAHN